ncbi:MAG: 2Fe-2S iron-sulfur cluster-binding protein [Hydrogenophilus thermoluteolus]
MTHTVQIANHPDATFTAAPDETVLDAALRSGLTVPYGCRDGACGACRARVVNGTVELKGVAPGVLSDDERAAGWTLLCRAYPRSDLTIEVRKLRRADDLPIHKFPARVETIEKIDDVAIVTLKLPNSLDFRFRAGQYVDVLLPDDARRSFSIASAPNHGGFLELHIRLVPGGRFTPKVFTETAPKTVWRLEGPFGTFTLKSRARPLLFVAGGTGFAPIQSLLLELAAGEPPQCPVLCYFGARTPAGLYRDAWLRAFAESHPWLDYRPVISEPEQAPDWTGRTGLVPDAVVAELSDLTAYDAYVCGSPAMVEAARARFRAANLPEEAFFADAFTFQSTPQ